jgi:hypothetical protein
MSDWARFIETETATVEKVNWKDECYVNAHDQIENQPTQFHLVKCRDLPSQEM